MYMVKVSYEYDFSLTYSITLALSLIKILLAFECYVIVVPNEATVTSAAVYQ